MREFPSLKLPDSEPRECSLFELQVQTVEALGFRYTPGCKVLDYGCDDGWLVRHYRNNGVQAYGCDVVLPDIPPCRELQEQGTVALVAEELLGVPFPDCMFDLVTS